MENKKGRWLIILVSVAMVLFWQVLASYFWGNKLMIIDQLINEWMIGIRKPWMDELAILITATGNGRTILVGSLLSGLILLVSGRKKCFGALMLSNLAGLIFVSLLKYSIGRLRPPSDDALISASGFSLPSGHSYFGVVFYGLMTYFLMKHFSNIRKKRLVFLMGASLIGLIGISRIYLGVHWLSDVIAGLATSSIWLAGVVTYLEKKKDYFSEKKKIGDKKMMVNIYLFVIVWFLVVIGQFRIMTGF